MEFGKLTDTDFDSINFTLPGEPDSNAAILSKEPRRTKFYVGCAKWGRKDWVGSIYPSGTKEAEFLSHYGKHFNGIELNASFYKMPSAAQTAAWASKVPPGFLFCPKFTGQISHVKRLKNVESLTERFLQGVAGFGENLGPLLLMPHPATTPKSLPTIQAFVDLLPSDLQLFIEFRHEAWFEKNNFNTLTEFLRSKNVGFVITDVAGRRDCAHMTLTTPKAFIRFNGNGLHPSDYRRIDEWVSRMHHWKDRGIHEVYFFMHQEDERHSPVLSKYLAEKLNERCGAGLTIPKFVES